MLYALSKSSIEAEKRKKEMRVFRDFLNKTKLGIDSDSIRSGDPENREPDIMVEAQSGSWIGYELTELCDSGLAEAVSGMHSAAIWTDDPSARILDNKLSKSYLDGVDVNLLIYWDGRTITPDDVAIPTLKNELRGYNGSSFKEIWYLGEESVTRLYPAGV